jgi:hypothetical protein
MSEQSKSNDRKRLRTVLWVFLFDFIIVFGAWAVYARQATQATPNIDLHPLVFTTEDPNVAVKCEVFPPHAKGCAILDGKTLDDLMNAVQLVKAEQDGKIKLYDEQTENLLQQLAHCKNLKEKK